LFHPRPLKAADIGATSRLSSGRIVRCFIKRCGSYGWPF
jgi:hypothetical protein